MITAFDDDGTPINSVGFDYPDHEPVFDSAPPDVRQFIAYILEGGHEESWKTRAAAVAVLAKTDGWETPQIAARRLCIDDSAIRKAIGKLRRNFLAREQLREIRANQRFSGAN